MAAQCYTAIKAMDSLQTVLPRALSEVLLRGPMSQGKLDLAWRVAVGEALSRVSSVRLQSGGVVEVQAVDSRWRRELKRSTAVILVRLQGLLGREAVTVLSVLSASSEGPTRRSSRSGGRGS
jgi:hypothetical protein